MIIEFKRFFLVGQTEEELKKTKTWPINLEITDANINAGLSH